MPPSPQGEQPRVRPGFGLVPVRYCYHFRFLLHSCSCLIVLLILVGLAPQNRQIPQSEAEEEAQEAPTSTLRIMYQTRLWTDEVASTPSEQPYSYHQMLSEKETPSRREITNQQLLAASRLILFYVLTLFGAVAMYIFCSQKGYRRSFSFLKKIFPSRSATFYHRSHFCIIVICGSVIGFVFYSPASGLEALAAGFGWVAAINIFLQERKT